MDWKLCDIQEIVAHYSTIASGNQVMRDAVDNFGARRRPLLRDGGSRPGEQLPMLVIRGICGHADSHKTNRWQAYASGAAAAYAKELLSMIYTTGQVSKSLTFDKEKDN